MLNQMYHNLEGGSDSSIYIIGWAEAGRTDGGNQNQNFVRRLIVYPFL